MAQLLIKNFNLSNWRVQLLPYLPSHGTSGTFRYSQIRSGNYGSIRVLLVPSISVSSWSLWLKFIISLFLILTSVLHRYIQVNEDTEVMEHAQSKRHVHQTLRLPKQKKSMATTQQYLPIFLCLLKRGLGKLLG